MKGALVLRLLKRAVPMAVVLALGLQGSAVATTRAVTIADFSFTPKAVGARVGDTVRWTNSSPGTQHTSTHDASDPLVWDSGAISPAGGTFTFVFRVAGVFTYHCNIHPFMTGSVRVRPTASPLSGPAGTRFAIRVATVLASGALVYDVQIRAPGGRFVRFVYGNRSGRVVFNSKGRPAGKYQFRARLRNTSTGKVSGFSPPVTITVT
jgi:plastocyanin